MGFSIASISKLRSTASQFSEAAVSGATALKSAEDALQRLENNISGYGVDNSLANLYNGLSVNGNKVIKLLNDISAFIIQQTSTYSTAATEASTDLQKVNANLENI